MKTTLRPKTPPKPIAVDLREAAELLHVDPMTLFKMLKKGKFPAAFRVGGVWRVDLDELQRVFKTSPKRAK